MTKFGDLGGNGHDPEVKVDINAKTDDEDKKEITETETKPFVFNPEQKASDTLEEFMKRYNKGQIGEQLYEKGMNLKEQHLAVEKISYWLLNPTDISKMNPEEKKKFNEMMDKKIITYNNVSKYTLGLVNPITIETKFRVKSMKKIKVNLEKGLESFETTYKGQGFEAKNTEFYGSLLKKFPDYIKKEPTFSYAIDKLETLAGEKTGGGIRDSTRTILFDIRNLKDVNDLVLGEMDVYDNKIGEIKNKIKDLNKQVKEDKKDMDLKQKRRDLSSMLNVYETKRFNLQDVQESVFDNLEELTDNYLSVKEEAEQYKAIIGETKNELQGLKKGIRTYESSIHTKDKRVQIVAHYGLLTRAKESGVALHCAGSLMQEVMSDNIRDLVEKGADGGTEYKSPNNNWSRINDQIVSQKKERVEAFLERLDDEIY